MDYGFMHEGRVFTPNESVITPDDNAERNAAIERAELHEWRRRPERFLGYVGEFRTSSQLTTWTGKPLGTILSLTTRRNNFGHRETHVTIAGNNGARYHGRYGSDWSQLVRIRKYRA
jgi:hypothetical protein